MPRSKRRAKHARPEKTRPEPGLTLDTGALIAFERRKRRVLALLGTALELGLDIRIPSAVVAEFFRGSHPGHVVELIDTACVPDTPTIAKRAGRALADVTGRPSVVDAIVAALASDRGDQILTSDPEDLMALADHFGHLRVLGV